MVCFLEFVFRSSNRATILFGSLLGLWFQEFSLLCIWPGKCSGIQSVVAGKAFASLIKSNRDWNWFETGWVQQHGFRSCGHLAGQVFSNTGCDSRASILFGG